MTDEEVNKIIKDTTEAVCEEISLSAIPATECGRLCERIRYISGMAIQSIKSYYELLNAAESFVSLTRSAVSSGNRKELNQ